MKLTNEEMKEYYNKKPIAYYGYGLGGFEVMGIIDDCDTYLVIRDKPKIYTRKVYESNKGSYIKMYGSRIYLDDIMRI